MSKVTGYLLLCVFCVVMYLPGILFLPVIDRDEAHFAQASRQMLQQHHYFQVRFQEITRFQKPPGINWLQAAAVYLFSDGDKHAIWPYRLPSLLATLLAVCLTYFLGGYFLSARAAFAAAAILACALLVAVETHMAVIDASLLSAVVLMQGALWFIYHQSLRHKKVHGGVAFVFWLAMTYGFLLKGVTPLVGSLTIISLCLIDKRWRWLSLLRPFSGFLLFCVLSVGWLSMLNAAEHSNYLLKMIHHDLLPKLQGGHESHGKPPFFHLAILPLTFWPGSLFLWPCAVYAYKQRHQPVVRFLLAWILPTWLFFEIMPTKLPQYVLPTFPALALLTAMAVEAANGQIPSKGLRLLQLLWGMLTIGLGLFIVVVAVLLQQGKIIADVIALLLTIVALGGVYFAWYGAYWRAIMVSVIAPVVVWPLVFSGFFPALSSLWISQAVATKAELYPISNQHPLLAVGYEEPSLVFYLNTHRVQFMSLNQALMHISTHPQELLLLPAPLAKYVPSSLSIVTLATVEGFNYNKGQWVKLLLVKPSSIEIKKTGSQ